MTSLHVPFFSVFVIYCLFINYVYPFIKLQENYENILLKTFCIFIVIITFAILLEKAIHSSACLCIRNIGISPFTLFWLRYIILILLLYRVYMPEVYVLGGQNMLWPMLITIVSKGLDLQSKNFFSIR